MSGPIKSFSFERDDRAIVDFECFHCGRTTKVVARRIAEAEIDYWKRQAERLNLGIEYLSTENARLRAGLEAAQEASKPVTNRPIRPQRRSR